MPRESLLNAPIDHKIDQRKNYDLGRGIVLPATTPVWRFLQVIGAYYEFMQLENEEYARTKDEAAISRGEEHTRKLEQTRREGRIAKIIAAQKKLEANEYDVAKLSTGEKVILDTAPAFIGGFTSDPVREIKELESGIRTRAQEY